jgi:hypothetical protein
MKQKASNRDNEKQESASAPLLAGANHYFQYDLAIGSTPLNCVDVFSLGASKSNAPVTHAVFPVDIAMKIARENHIVPVLDLEGPTVLVHLKELSMLPSGFNNSNYTIKVVKLNTTRTDTEHQDTRQFHSAAHESSFELSYT